MKITSFIVLPETPEALNPLKEIAYNMWYSWNWEAVKLFITLDPEYWEKSYQSPINMLCMLPLQKLEEAAQNQDFLSQMNRVYESFQNYLKEKPGLKKSLEKRKSLLWLTFPVNMALMRGYPSIQVGLVF